jgi:hypothetical protein
LSLSSPLRLWTSDERLQVRAMLDAGKHFSDIAAIFHLSRNAVAGRVNRDRELHDHVQFVPKKVRRIRAKKSGEAPSNGKPFRAEPAPSPAGSRRQPMRLVPLMELRKDECRWPVTQDRSVIGGFLFCGRPTAFGEVYCPPHRKMAAPKGRDDG